MGTEIRVDDERRDGLGEGDGLGDWMSAEEGYSVLSLYFIIPGPIALKICIPM